MESYKNLKKFFGAEYLEKLPFNKEIFQNDFDFYDLGYSTTFKNEVGWGESTKKKALSTEKKACISCSHLSTVVFL